MYSQTHIDPLISFRNAQGTATRGTVVNLQRKALVMEVYNPYSIMQVSEVLNELTVRFGTKVAYMGKAVVISMVNTGLTAFVSLTLLDEWCELSDVALLPGGVGAASQAFVREWSARAGIRRDYQIVVNETRAFLSDVARWLEQVDLPDALPKQDQRLLPEYFYELATPLMRKTKSYFDELNGQASLVEDDLAPAHRAFAQAALHPLLLRAPFVHRTFTKPLGYAGDYQMVNQILGDPRQGPSTYFQIINTAFLQTAVATAHRHRVELLTGFLKRTADLARAAGRPYRILNIGCGPAAEIVRFIDSYPEPHWLSFELLDFSAETLAWTGQTLAELQRRVGKTVAVDYVQDSVHQLLKRRVDAGQQGMGEFDAVYCAGLYDYLSDKVCTKLTAYFASRTRAGGTLLLTNVHTSNPERYSMEHVLEWYLIYRDEARLQALLPAGCGQPRLYTDPTGVNVFIEAQVAPHG